MIRLHCRNPPPLDELLLTDVERSAAEERYWNPSCFYQLSAASIERRLKPAVEELWALCRDFAARAVVNSEILSSLGIPEFAWDGIGESWRRSDPVALARFDLSFDGVGQPRLHECNIDVVGLLFEATLFQKRWFDHQEACDPALRKTVRCAGIEDSLAGVLAPGAARLVSFRPDPYDALWTETLASVLEQQGVACSRETFDSLEAFGSAVTASPTGKDRQPIIKNFRWDHISAHPQVTSQLVRAAPLIFSPMWSMVLSSKGCLPWLWKFNRGHPNLLPASFDPADLAQSPGVVAKPLLSIQGQNITLEDRAAPQRSTATPGPDTGGRRIFQELCYLPEFAVEGGACWASTGAWIVGERFAAINLTESNGPVISGDSIRCVPHILDS